MQEEAQEQDEMWSVTWYRNQSIEAVQQEMLDKRSYYKLL